MIQDKTNSKLLDRAIVFATKAHRGTLRKKDGIPYILHPMEVASIAGGITTDVEVLTAALLHDTVEDTDVTLDTIKSQFGDRVAALVASETEDKRRDRSPAETWMQRKVESLAALRNAVDPGVRVLWLSDKLANMRSFARQYEKEGDRMWKDYNQTDPAQQAWYYRTIEALTSDLKDTNAWKELRALNARVFGGVKE
jgi:(p)ppGpp synthase/HD superfamily hydrolase